MATGSTSRAHVPYPLSSDSAIIASDIQAVAQFIDTNVPTYVQSASTPATPVNGNGEIWWCTDNTSLYYGFNYWDGNNWFNVTTQMFMVGNMAPSPVFPGLVWYDTTNVNGAFKYWSGTAWVSIIPTTATNGQVLTSSSSGSQWVTPSYVPNATGVTNGYVLTASGGTYSWTAVSDSTKLPLSGGTMTGAIAMGSHKITGLSNGTTASDAAAFGQIPTTLPPSGSAGGSLAGTYPNPTLSTTGVSASTYGSATTAPQIAVNSEGRITSASSVTITGTTPGGAAGGDLTGTYPNPTLIATGTAGTYGSGTSIPTITTDSKGRVTSVTTNAATDTTKIPLSTVSAVGDIILGSGSSTVTRLGIGTNGSVLTSNGTTATWATPTIAANTTFISPIETANVVSGASTGTIAVNVTTSSLWYYNSSATGNFTLNIQGSNSVTLNSILSVGQSITVVFMNTNGSTPYYMSGLKIDSTTVTPKWQGTSAPSAGNANATDVYTLLILKTAANTYTVLASLVPFA